MSLSPATLPQTCPRLRHILSGTFNTVFLHLLTFDTLTRSLTLTLSIPALGPHQFLTLGSIPQDNKRIAYATTWDAVDRHVSSWAVDLSQGKEKVELVNKKKIIAAGSYVAVSPPAYDSNTTPAYGVDSILHQSSASSQSGRQYLYQAGGPTGEVFPVNPVTGEIGEMEQQLIYLKGGEEELKTADKTRKSLRYGAHNVDFDVNGLAYVADLGRNAILIYSQDPFTGQLTLLSETASPTKGDGPRHVVPSSDGKWVFAVTEHNSFVDAYRLQRDSSSSAPTLQHVQRASLLPSNASEHDFRGDTVRLSPSGQWIFATTRGSKASQKGWVKGWKLDLSADQPLALKEEDQVTYQTPTSGGKANAWEWAPRYPLDAPVTEGEDDLAVLTDDSQGYIMVMQWDGKDLKEVARTQLPATTDLVEGEREGASHAVWLS